MIGKLQTIVFDAADIRGLASFYRDLAGWSELGGDDEWITLATREGHHIAFQAAPDHVAPRWPDPKHPQQMHLDFLVPDRPAAVEQAVSLGAARLPGGGESWTVLADPAGHPFCLCDGDGVDGVTLADLGIDVPDGKAAAAFYAELLGLGVTYEGDEGAAIGGDGALTIMFQNVDEYHAPQWPDPAFPQQIHLDVDVEDVGEGEARVLALGATKLYDSGGTARGFRVYADPVGHPFCLCWGQ